MTAFAISLMDFPHAYPTQWRFLTSVFAFFLVIGPAIFIHELGHFLLAKLFRVKVFVFSMGFGPKLWSFEAGGTEYRLSWFPLGGYVKMAGEDPAEVHEGTPDEFASKPIWQRVLIILAGPAANVVLGFLLGIGIYMAGLQSEGWMNRVGYVAEESPLAGVVRPGDEITSVNGKPVTSWFEVEPVIMKSLGREVTFTIQRETESFEAKSVPIRIEYAKNLGFMDRLQVAVAKRFEGEGTLGIAPWLEPVIGDVKEDGPASKAGLRPLDRVLRINDSTVIQWPDIGRTVRNSGGETLALTVLRGSDTFLAMVKPDISFSQKPDGSIERFMAIGITVTAKPKPRGFLHSTASAVFMTWRLGRLVIVTLGRLISGEISVKLLAGPVGIAQGSGVSFREGGVTQLIYFLALISVNLGVVNLFPLPLLDGGWIFIFLTWESLRGRPMSQKIQERIMQAGMVLLLGLVILITFNDLQRILGFQKLSDIVGEEKK